MNLPYRTLSEMDICTTPDADYFNNHFGFPAKPVLIKGVASGWEAFSKWTPAFFTKHYGNLPVRVTRTDESDATIMLLGDYFSYLHTTQEKNPWYLKDWQFDEDCPELVNDFEVPAYFSSWLYLLPEAQRPKLRWFYIGPAGSGSHMHLDTMDTSAWNAVLSGKKHWLFFSADQAGAVYNGEVDAFNPDVDRFPLLADSSPIYCVQEPGDIVFTPSGWWHQVHNEKAGISITENFVNETNHKEVEKHFLNNGMMTELEMLYDVRTKTGISLFDAQ